MLPVLGACILGYFAYHTVQGERGVLAYWRIAQEVERSEARLALLTADRIRAEARVGLLRRDGLDLDMLEEQARALFNLTHPNDLVILRDTDW